MRALYAPSTTRISQSATNAGFSFPCISTVTKYVSKVCVGVRDEQAFNTKRARMFAPSRTGATKRSFSNP